MNVSALSGLRFELALEHFRHQKEPLVFDFFGVTLNDDQSLCVRVESSFRPEHATKESAYRDISEAMKALERLMQISSDLRELFQSRRRHFEVVSEGILVYHHDGGRID